MPQIKIRRAIKLSPPHVFRTWSLRTETTCYLRVQNNREFRCKHKLSAQTWIGRGTQFCWTTLLQVQNTIATMIMALIFGAGVKICPIFPISPHNTPHYTRHHKMIGRYREMKRRYTVMSRWVKEEPLSLCRRQGSVRHKLKSFMFIQWTRSSELQLFCKVDSLYCTRKKAVSIQMLPTCHGARLCVAFINLCPLLKCALQLGDSSFISFHDTTLSHAIEGIWFIHHCKGWFRKGMLF